MTTKAGRDDSGVPFRIGGAVRGIELRRSLAAAMADRGLSRLEWALARIEVARQPSPLRMPAPIGEPASAAADAACPSARSRGASRERRAFPRRDSECTVLVHRIAPGTSLDPLNIDWLIHSSKLKGNLVDISMNGVAFQLPEPVDMDERLWLRLVHRMRGFVDAPGTVIRISPRGDGQWKVVCRLDDNLTFEQVHTLGHYLFSSRYV
jgi:hypothetical protein